MNFSQQIYNPRPLPMRKRLMCISFDEEESGGPNKRLKQASSTIEHMGEAYSHPHSRFVLCGRGEKTNRHPGNKCFRRVVESNRAKYQACPKNHKALISRSIVEAIYRQDPPGRFVREDKESGLWIDIGMKEAIKKTSQALRENLEEKKKKRKSSKDEDEPDHTDDCSEGQTDDEGDSKDKNQEEDQNRQDKNASRDSKRPASRDTSTYSSRKASYDNSSITVTPEPYATPDRPDEVEDDEFAQAISAFAKLTEERALQFDYADEMGMMPGPPVGGLTYQTSDTWQSVSSDVVSVVSLDGNSPDLEPIPDPHLSLFRGTSDTHSITNFASI